MTRKFIDRLKRTGLLSLAGIVAVVSILFNIYQFTVNKKMQREAHELELHESWWAWFDRAEHLAAQRDSMVQAFLSKYDRARELVLLRPRQEVTDSLSVSVEKLILASSIWESQAGVVVEAMTVVYRQLNRGLENDSGRWLPHGLLKEPPARQAHWAMFRAAMHRQRRALASLDVLDVLDDKRWKKAWDGFEDELRWLLDYPLYRLRAPEDWKIDKP